MGFISFQNFLDDPAVVLTSPNSFEAGLPLSNARTRPLSQVARAVDLGSTTIRFDIDLGRSQTIGVVGILGHSRHMQRSSTFDFFWRYTMRIRVWAEATMTTALFDTGTEFADCFYSIADEYPGYAMRLIDYISDGPSPISARFLTIEFTNVGGSGADAIPSTFVNDFGRIWVGRAPRPEFSGSWKVGSLDQGASERSPGGQSLNQYGARLRQLECKLAITDVNNALGGIRSSLTASIGSASWTMQQIQARRGVTGEVFIAVRDGSFHDINNTGVYGTFTNNGFAASHLFANYFDHAEAFTVLEER